MNSSRAVLWRDLKRLVRNPIALMVALGLCVVPCLYAWVNILANWDPYKNTSTIPVAIVNEDAPAFVSDDVGEVCVGDLVEGKLKDNDAIGWKFLKRDDAIEEVRAGTSYAAIVIPKDFTATLAGILDANTDKAHLTYYVNEKVNAVSPKVTDAGASTIEQTIDEQFIAVVGRVIAEKFGSLAQNLIDDTRDATVSVSDALAQADVALSDVSGDLGGLIDKLTGAQAALSNATEQLQGLQGKGSEIADSVQSTLEGFAERRAKTSALARDLDAALGQGASSIASVSSSATSDITTLSIDIATASAQVNDAIKALETDLSDNRALTSRIEGTRDLAISYNPLGDPARRIQTELTGQLTPELDLMVQLTAEQEAKIEELRGIATKLEGASREVDQLARSLDGTTTEAVDKILATRTGTVATSINQASAALDTFVSVATRLESAARLVDPIVEQTVGVAESLAASFKTTGDALAGTDASIGEIGTSMTELTEQLSAVSASRAWSALTSIATTNPEGIHDFLTAPVSLDENRVYPIANYASGITPFFTSLSIWVTGIALVAIFKLEVDEDEVGSLKPWQAYLGRWALFVLLGLIQACVVVTGDLALGIQCTYVWALFLSAIVSSFVFVTIIFSLSVAFKHLGKAIAFTLVILQVPGSSGMYPIEMMPPFFRAIGPWLPFTYSNNAMREAIGGLYGNNLAYNLGMLLLFAIPSMLVGITCRSHLVNINALFDRRLRETDHLMVSETTEIVATRYRLATVVKAIHTPDAYREAVERRAAAFERAYPHLVRRGIACLLLLPPILLVLACVVDEKLPLIGLLVVSLVAIYAYLIMLEYLEDHFAHKRALVDLSPAELEDVLLPALSEEVLATVPIDDILEIEGRALPHEQIATRIHERVTRRRARRADSGIQVAPVGTEEPSAAEDVTSKGGERR